MRAHLMTTKRHFTWQEVHSVISPPANRFVYLASAFKNHGEVYSSESRHWHVKIRPIKILQSTEFFFFFLQAFIGKLQKWAVVFFLRRYVVEILKDKYTRGCWLLCVKVTSGLWEQHLYMGPVMVSTSPWCLVLRGWPGLSVKFDQKDKSLFLRRMYHSLCEGKVFVRSNRRERSVHCFHYPALMYSWTLVY